MNSKNPLPRIQADDGKPVKIPLYSKVLYLLRKLFRR